MSNNGAEERIVAIARSVLEGKMGILEAAHALSSLLHCCPTAVSKEDFNLIVGIHSETDDLPIGIIRKEWHPAFFPEKYAEIARFELLWGDRLRAACERMVLKNQQPE